MTASDFPRDQWGRPKVVPPGGGKPVAYARFSSWGSVLEERYNLEKWSQRMVALGIAQHEHLRAQVAAAPPEDKARIDKLCEEAKKLAGSDTGSGLGTALHEFTARVDTGTLRAESIIDPYRADVAAYLTTLASHGFDVVPELVEVQLVHDELRLAGTADRFLRRPDGRLVCADVKTGKAMWGNPIGYVVQLAAYATSVLYDIDKGTRTPVGDVDTTVGYLIHLPAGRAECALYEVDLVAGLELARLAGVVRATQKRKDLLRIAKPAGPDMAPSVAENGQTRPGGTTRPDTPGTPIADDPFVGLQGEPVHVGAAAKLVERVTWIRDRILTLKGLGATIAWPADLVTPKAALAGASVTDADVDRMAAVLDAAERAVRAPFPPEDPATPEPERAAPPPARSGSPTPPRPAEGQALTDAERDELKAWVAERTRDRDVAELVTRVAREGGRELVVAANPSVRRRTLAMALVRLAAHGEEALRAACALVIPDAARPAVTIGSALAAMTIDEATRLLAIAEALDGRSLGLSFTEDGAPVLVEVAA